MIALTGTSPLDAGTSDTGTSWAWTELPGADPTPVGAAVCGERAPIATIPYPMAAMSTSDAATAPTTSAQGAFDLVSGLGGTAWDSMGFASAPASAFEG